MPSSARLASPARERIQKLHVLSEVAPVIGLLIVNSRTGVFNDNGRESENQNPNRRLRDLPEGIFNIKCSFETGVQSGGLGRRIGSETVREPKAKCIVLGRDTPIGIHDSFTFVKVLVKLNVRAADSNPKIHVLVQLPEDSTLDDFVKNDPPALGAPNNDSCKPAKEGILVVFLASAV